MESAMVERYQSAYLDEDDYPPYAEPEVVGPNEIPSDSLDDGSSSEEETEELQQIFDYIDRDRDGFITLDEMLRAEKRMADHRGSLFDEHAKRKELSEFIRDGDLNKDQKLDFKEFVMSMKLRVVGQERGYENESESDSTDEDTRPQSRKHRKSRRKPSRKSSMTDLASTPIGSVKRRARTRNAKWEAEKSQVIAPDSNEETQERLGNLFLAADPDRDGLVDINDLATLVPTFFDETAPGFSDERREGILAVKREAPTMPLMNAEQFSLLLSQRLLVTNEELKDQSDIAAWNRISTPSFDSTNMTLDESRVASTNLASVLTASLNIRPSTNAAENASHIQRLQRALQLAIGMSDTLLEQFESAKAIAEEASSKLRSVEEELETAKVEKREAQRKLKMLQIQITDLETESAETANQVRRLQSTLKQERDAHIDKERRKRGDSDESVSVDSVQKNISAWTDQVQRAEAQSQALFRAYDTEKRSLVEATDKWRKLEQERKQAGNPNPSPAELAQIDVVKKLKASTEQYRDELMQEINSLQSLQQAAQNVQSLKKNMMDQLNDKKTPQIPPQTPRTTGADPGKDRSHAERNQEFFFLTALAVKMNLETRYKAANQKAPTFTPTKKLYELAMAARVPFQYYAKWIERQLDPVAAQRKQSGASNPPTSLMSVTSPPVGPTGAPAGPPPIAGGMQSRPQ